MKRLFGRAAIAVAFATVAGYGAFGYAAVPASARAEKPAKTAEATVAARRVDGMRILVDKRGRALYRSDEEAGGMVRCTGACTSFWKPLTVSGGQPTGKVPGQLGVVTRPDGKTQVTYNGAPLYRFVEDRRGTISGDGFEDAFGGRRFTWHVVTASGHARSDSSDGSNRGGGSSDDYGY
jgi:predicted lipoprotein with Yx(FWY)xxD motif